LSTPAETRARALDLLVAGDTAGGISDLRAYLEAEPDDGEAWLALGTAYATIAHTVQAADALRRAVDLDGEDVEARLAYARVLVRLSKLDEAAFQLGKAARLEPPDPRVLRELGVVFYDKRLYDKAAAWLGRAVAAAPGDARAWYALGLAHEARRDVGAALAAYREAVRKDGSLVDARLTLADALAGIGEHEEAIAELSAILAANRTHEKAAQNREVLFRALTEMRAHRLLGKTAKELEASALLVEGAFRNKGVVEGTTTLRYAAPLVEVYATPDDAGVLRSLLLVLTDPDRAARSEDDVYKVTVLGADGGPKPVDFGTAATLTFLREALGCPLTQASTLYARLLAGESALEWGGATLAFDSIPRPDRPAERRHGVRVSLR
jgi:tetratricopeptide (TPR) repeat protein